MTDTEIVPPKRDRSPAGRRSVPTPWPRSPRTPVSCMRRATTQLAGALPQLVNKIIPDGKLPDPAEISGSVGKLLRL
jgi:hypothetical protein